MRHLPSISSNQMHTAHVLGHLLEIRLLRSFSPSSRFVVSAPPRSQLRGSGIVSQYLSTTRWRSRLPAPLRAAVTAAPRFLISRCSPSVHSSAASLSVHRLFLNRLLFLSLTPNPPAIAQTPSTASPSIKMASSRSPSSPICTMVRGMVWSGCNGAKIR